MKLLIEDDEGNRSVVPVIRDEITIGRKEGNTIRLTERNVSRHHARLVRRNGALYVEDVEARYGIKKNGQKIDDRAQFGEGDVVSIGDYRLTLRPEKAADTGADVNGDAAAEISSELQNRSTQVTKMDDVEGAPSSGGGQPPPQPGQSGGQNRSETEVMEAEAAELVVVSSNFAGQEFPLDRDEMVIGRGDECDIIIDHRSVSNKHAKVVRESPASYKIVDLNSRNGVKIDGEEYKSVHLERGDVVELGHVKFRFVEPGENYVFSPQSAGASQADDMGTGAQPSPEPTQSVSSPDVASSSSSSGMDPKVLGGGVVGLLAVVAAGFFLMSGGGESTDTDSEQTVTDEAAAGETAGGGATGDDGKVAKQIEKAKQELEQGKLDSAKTILETTQEMRDPSADQSKRIDDILSEAATEKPNKAHYEQAVDHIEDDEWEEALAKLGEISSFSVFRDIAEDEGHVTDVLDGVLEKSKGALDSGDFEQARTLASKVTDWEARQKKAEALLDRIDRAEKQAGTTEVAAANNNAGTATQQPAGSGPGDGPAGTGQPPGGSDSTGNGGTGGGPTGGGSADGSQTDESPEDGTGGSGEPAGSGGDSSGGGGSDGSGSQVTAAQAKELFRGATKKWIRGNHAGAISDCRKALKAGHSPCYRVMGMASKQMGKTSQACRYFKKYLSTSPKDASKIRDKMDEAGCN